MLQKAKEGLFFFGAFMLVVWLLSFLAPRPVGATPQADWQELAAPYLPGLVAIVKGLLLAAAFTVLAALLCFILLPFRDWMIHRQQLHAEEHRRKMLHVPVNHYGSVSNHRPPAMAQIDPRELKHLRQDHQLLYSRVAAICDKHIGGERPATTHGLVIEIEYLVSRFEAQLQEQSVAPAQAAPSGPNWRAIAHLVEWARSEPKLRFRATRDAFRAAGVPVPEVDARKGGGFGEWVKVTGMEPASSPTAPSVSVVGDSTLKDGGQSADDATDDENEPTDAPPVGEGRSDKVARFIIPRLARKRKGERCE